MVLLLGATGLLGQNVLRELLLRGIPVRALVRSSLDVPGVDAVYGNILLEDDLLKAADGCSAIINCAGTTDMTLPKVEDFLPVNRDLPRLMCKVAQKCGIDTIIHTSSANTIVCGTKEHPSDETAPFGAPYDKSPYAISKKAGEDELLHYDGKARIVIVNPAFMLGPYDLKLSSGQMVVMGWKKPVVLVTGGAKSILHVRDAAVAIVNALERGRGRYLLTGETITFKEYYRLQARLGGYRQLCIAMPHWAVECVGFMGKMLLKAGIRNMIYPHNLRQMECQEWYDSSRARKELGYPSTPVEDAVRDYVSWRYGV